MYLHLPPIRRYDLRRHLYPTPNNVQMDTGCSSMSVVLLRFCRVVRGHNRCKIPIRSRCRLANNVRGQSVYMNR